MKNNLIELQNILRQNGILISFSGKFSQGIIEELGDAIKKYMEDEERPQNDVFNVFAIFIEQSQNIKNYSKKNENSIYYDKISNSGIVNIGKSENEYFIWSRNLIKNSDIAVLTQKLESIKKMDKSELKKYYKEQIKKDVPIDSLGAGVGLIEIARKASKPIEYSINKADEEFSFYELRVIV